MGFGPTRSLVNHRAIPKILCTLFSASFYGDPPALVHNGVREGSWLGSFIKIDCLSTVNQGGGGGPNQ